MYNTFIEGLEEDSVEGGVMKVNTYVSGAVCRFAYWFAHGTLGHPMLEGISYVGEAMMEESSFVEQAFAIFMNNLQLDEEGRVLNFRYCEERAAQYIRSYFDRDYKIMPPLDEWEVELYHYN